MAVSVTEVPLETATEQLVPQLIPAPTTDPPLGAVTVSTGDTADAADFEADPSLAPAPSPPPQADWRRMIASRINAATARRKVSGWPLACEFIWVCINVLTGKDVTTL